MKSGNERAKRLIAFVCGDRLTQTDLKLYQQIEEIPVGVSDTDRWKSYCEFLPSHQHIQDKKDSRIRHYLARFKRKTKCYSRFQVMIQTSLNLLYARAKQVNN